MIFYLIFIVCSSMMIIFESRCFLFSQRIIFIFNQKQYDSNNHNYIMDYNIKYIVIILLYIDYINNITTTATNNNNKFDI